jgi:hypothetical protein
MWHRLLRDGNWVQLGKQVAWIAVGVSWTFVVTYAIMFVINLVPGLHFRASEEAEVVGMDVSRLGSCHAPNPNTDMVNLIYRKLNTTNMSPITHGYSEISKATHPNARLPTLESLYRKSTRQSVLQPRSSPSVNQLPSLAAWLALLQADERILPLASVISSRM